jgi:hypothetical protein
MPQASWFTRLSPLGSIVGALLTGISLFFPLIQEEPLPFRGGGSDVFTPTLNGGWLLRSFLTPQSQLSPWVTWSYALLVALAVITLGVGIVAWFRQASTPGVVIWIRAIAAVGGLVALIWFLEGAQLLNFHIFGTTSLRFSMGFGIVFLALGTALSALGLGPVGIGALVGAAIGYLFFSPLALFAVPIVPITCLLGTFVGWLIQRAMSKSTSVASS